MNVPGPGWYRDPTGRYTSRYWDGQQWTNQVNSGGANAVDEAPSEMRFVPPAPGTETAAAPPAPPRSRSPNRPRARHSAPCSLSS